MGVKRLVCLASGRGSNFAAIADAVREGAIAQARIAGLVSNNPDAPALGLAKERGIPTRVVASRDFRSAGKLDRDRYEAELEKAVAFFAPDFVLLAGYMLFLGPRLLKAYPNRIVNIHPSLLPSFRGLHAQAQALDAGVRWAGCTVHFVNEELDGGPILAQSVVEVLDDDTEETLSARLLPIEHATYVKAVKRICEEPFEIRGNRVLWKTPR